MKLRLQELALMLLPCVGLLGFGLAFKPSRQARLPGVVGPVASSSSPVYASLQRFQVARPEMEPGARYSTDVRSSLSFTSRPTRPVRWYYNCRIEGTLLERPHVFYASGGYDRYKCLRLVHPFDKTELSTVIQHTFDLSRLPSDSASMASHLTFTIEAVALEGTPAEPQEMSRGELAQAMRSKRRVGYAVNSTDISANAFEAPPRANGPDFFRPNAAGDPRIRHPKYLDKVAEGETDTSSGTS